MREEILGVTSVDTGCIVITDPCYVVGDRYTEKDIDNTDWSNKSNPLFKDQPHLGIIHRTRYGDGTYPIIATYDDHDMIVSIRVEFGSH